MGVTTILFDLDGTLTDPKEGIVNCIHFALKELGIEIDRRTDLTSYIGPPLHLAFRELIKTDDSDVINSAIELYRSRFKDRGMYENLVYEGIEALLKFLSASKCNLFVATSKPHIFASEIITHFNLQKYFSGVYGSELDGSLSDKTSLIGHILDKEKIDPHTCYMVGDRKHDAIGAMNNRVTPVGVLWGYGSEAELRSCGVDLIHSAPHELKYLAS